MKFSNIFTQAVSLLSVSLAVEGHSISRTEGSSPHQPFRPIPMSKQREQTCHVLSYGDGRDDSAHIMSALRNCNHGGKVIFDADKKYIIGTALDMTFLRHVDLDYWQAHSFKHGYQNVTTFFNLGGEDVNVYGDGTVDGNGQVWYDLYAQNDLILRPILMGIIGLKGGTIGPLNLRYSPQWYHFVANSSDLVFEEINISGYSKSKNVAKNTDGWDIYRSSNIVVQNSVINNGDDCVSFKPNSTEILVQNLHCNGSHGISVGSLGQYKNEVDIAKDVLNSMTLCNEYPSNMSISDIHFKNFNGVNSGKYDPDVGTIVCSSPDVCSDIYADHIQVTSPPGDDEFVCTNVNDTMLHVNCVSN